jgi:outer membrane protein insertion porin family
MQELYLIPLATIKTNALFIKINVERRNKYYFGNVKFLGTPFIQVIGPTTRGQKGETYNGVLLEKNCGQIKT